MSRQFRYNLLSAITISLIGFSTSSANAVQLDLTELRTSDTDGVTTNTQIFSGTEVYTPIGLTTESFLNRRLSP